MALKKASFCLQNGTTNYNYDTFIVHFNTRYTKTII